MSELLGAEPITVITALIIHFVEAEHSEKTNTVENIVEIHELHYFLYLGLAIIPIIFISKGLIILVEKYINSSTKIRKILYGRYFVEGYWLEKTFKKENPNNIVSLAIIKFDFQRSNITVSGEAFDINENVVGSFNSLIVKYIDYRLTYAYGGTHKSTEFFDVVGHGEFFFTPGTKIPTSFNGRFQDTYKFKDGIWIQGDKIMKKKIIAKLDDKEFRKKLVENYLKTGKIEE